MKHEIKDFSPYSEHRTPYGSIRLDAAFEFVPGEEFSGTFGRGTRHIAMAYDVLVGNAVKALERDHEEGQRIEHLVRKPGLAIIADHRNTDRFLVPISLFGMSPVHLLHPAGPDFDLTR